MSIAQLTAKIQTKKHTLLNAFTLISQDNGFKYFLLREVFLKIFYCCSLIVVPIFPPLPSSGHPITHFCSQFPHCCPCPWAIHTCCLTSPFPFFAPLSPSLLHSGHCQSVPCFHVCGSILFVSLFCSLDSSYKVRSYGICFSLPGLSHLT